MLWNIRASLCGMGEAAGRAAEPADAAHGVVLSPEQEEAFEQMLVETDEDERAGRLHTLEEVLAKLRAA